MFVLSAVLRRANGTRVASYTRSSPSTASSGSSSNKSGAAAAKSTPKPTRTKPAAVKGPAPRKASGAGGSPAKSTSKASAKAKSNTRLHEMPSNSLRALAKMGKKGNSAEQKDASHVSSLENIKHMEKSRRGRPITSVATKKSVATAANHGSNLRMKSQHGNRVVDRANDKALRAAITEKKAVRVNSGPYHRAVQVVKRASVTRTALGALPGPNERYATAVGQLHVATGQPGRPAHISTVAAAGAGSK